MGELEIAFGTNKRSVADQHGIECVDDEFVQ